MIQIHGESRNDHGRPIVQSLRDRATRWLQHLRHCPPYFVCVLGFTETALIPGISAAGATPHDRQTTALADAECLANGPVPNPCYPLPPLTVGVSPALITRALLETQSIPAELFNAGLPQPLPVPHADLGGAVARCVSTGQAIAPDTVRHLFHMGLQQGQRLADQLNGRYVVVGECVVGGTTTALAVLMGLGWSAQGRVNSSHAHCNHDQKQAIVAAGLQSLRRQQIRRQQIRHRQTPESTSWHPADVVAAVGDPMQPVVAGMAIAASRRCGVLLAGGTQMIAVYALAAAWAERETLTWTPDQVVVGTTRWVANDPTGDTVGLATEVGVPLLATRLSFQHSQHAALRQYEQGFVKEGVGAGGCAIAATLHQDWTQSQLLAPIDALVSRYQQEATLNVQKS